VHDLLQLGKLEKDYKPAPAVLKNRGHDVMVNLYTTIKITLVEIKNSLLCVRNCSCVPQFKSELLGTHFILRCIGTFADLGNCVRFINNAY
jgi:hypothetical protein